MSEHQILFAMAFWAVVLSITAVVRAVGRLR